MLSALPLNLYYDNSLTIFSQKKDLLLHLLVSSANFCVIEEVYLVGYLTPQYGTKTRWIANAVRRRCHIINPRT